MRLLIILLFVSTSLFAQRKVYPGTAITLADIGNLAKTIKKPNTDSIFSIVMTSNASGAYDTTWNFRYIINSRITTKLANDISNASAVANTLADVTGLSFSVTSGLTYKFKFFVVYTAAAATTGSRWTISAPNVTGLNYRSEYTLTGTSRTFNEGVSAINLPAAASASSLTAGNIAIVEGVIRPSANGTVQLRFASEILSSAIVAKAGVSYVEYEIIN